jgi:hypothetical protein
MGRSGISEVSSIREEQQQQQQQELLQHWLDRTLQTQNLFNDSGIRNQGSTASVLLKISL